MRISDWSSDVGSSDLAVESLDQHRHTPGDAVLVALLVLLARLLYPPLYAGARILNGEHLPHESIRSLMRSLQSRLGDRGDLLHLRAHLFRNGIFQSLLAGLAQRVRGFRYRSGERLARSLSSLFGGILDAQQRLDQLGSSLFGQLASLTVRSRNGAGQLLYLNTVGHEMRLRTR